MGGQACLEAEGSSRLIWRIVADHFEAQQAKTQEAIVELLACRPCVPVSASTERLAVGGGDERREATSADGEPRMERDGKSSCESRRR